MTWTARRLAVHPTDRATLVSLVPDGAGLLVADARGLTLLDVDQARRSSHPWDTFDAPAARSGESHPVLWARHPWEAPDAAVWTPTGDAVFLTVAGRVRALRAGSGADLELPAGLAAVRSASVLAMEPTGEHLAVGTSAGTVLVHQLRRGETRELRMVDPVTALCWNGTNSLLVATDNDVQVWDTARRSLVRTAFLRGDGITGLCRTRDGRRIAVLDRRGVQLMEAGSNRPALAAELPAPAAGAFSRDETRLLVGTGAGLYVLDLDLRQHLVLPGAIVARGHLCVERAGLIAVRTDDRGVTVFAPSDAVARAERERDTFAARRWAAGMAATVGRALGVAHEERPLVARPTPIEQAGTGCPVPGFAWTADSGWICESPAGRLVRMRPGEPEPVWERYLGDPVYELAVDPTGTWLAAATSNRTGRVQVFEAATGTERYVLRGGQSPVFAPGGRDLLAVPETGNDPRAVLVYDLSTGDLVRRLPADEGIGRLAWSTGGDRLAGAASGRAVVWDTGDWQRERVLQIASARAPAARVAWSPDDQFLAVAPVAGRGDTEVFLTSSWQHLRTLGAAGGRAWAPALAWSPDSRLVACPATGRDTGHVEIWNGITGKLLCRIPPPLGVQSLVWTVTWSPGGDALAVSYAGGPIVRYDLGRPTTEQDGPLRYPVPLLASLGGHSAAQGGAAPLSLLVELLDHTGADTASPALEPLADLRGVRALRALRWPPEARIGVVAMLARDLGGETRFAAPRGSATEELIAQLQDALFGEVVTPSAPETPIADLARVLQEVDERTLTLLQLLGPTAVAEDPALPARMRGLRANLSALSPRQHRLLSVRLTVRDSGLTEGGGSGDERAGLARHGNINRLLPTQLALPTDVFALRYAEGNLLFRTRRGKLPPEPRSAIVLLDDTPAAHGLVGVTLRTCAHLLAAALLGRQRRCVLIPLGAPADPVFLTGPADLLRIWTVCSTEPPRLGQVAGAVSALAPGLTDRLGAQPLVILLTHPFLPPPALPGIRTVAVSYPGAPARPMPRRPDWHLIPAEPTATTLRAVLTQVLRESA